MYELIRGQSKNQSCLNEGEKSKVRPGDATGQALEKKRARKTRVELLVQV